MNRKIAIVAALLFAPLAVWSASPYRLRGEILFEPEDVRFECAGAKLSFYNAAKKSVRSFSVVLFLCGADGNLLAGESGAITLDFDCDVLPRETYETELSLDEWLGENGGFGESDDEYGGEEASAAYQIEFLYARRIEYEDGSAWEDEFGQNAPNY